MTDLDARLIAAHEAGDLAALVALYQSAAGAAGTVDATCFYLTQAYVFALETNHPATEAIRQRLVAEGREPA